MSDITNPLALRFTGVNPPVELLEKYSNWELALDEEDVDGQDEGTLRIHANQNSIDDFTVFTVADIELPAGHKVIGFVSIISKTISSVDFMFGNEWYRISLIKGDWVPSGFEDWILAEERFPKFEKNDERFFPMKVTTRLPLVGGDKIVLDI